MKSSESDSRPVFKAIVFSATLNLIVFSLFIILLDEYRKSAIVLTISFLLVYLLFFQPMKDFIFSSMVNRSLFKKQAHHTSFEDKAANLSRRDEVPEFLSWLAKHLKVQNLRLTLYLDNPIEYSISYKGKIETKIFSIQDHKEFIGFLTAFPWTHKSRDLPPSLRRFLSEKNIKAVSPVIFRENVIGVIGLEREINETETDATEFISRKIAIVLENDQLTQTISRNELLRKEFIVADRVEEFLMREKPIEAFGYSISRLHSAWEKKYFSALYEVTIAESKKSAYILLARLSIGSVRANALQLFGVQGYFKALSRNPDSVISLSENLNRALIEHENGKVNLDGFIVEIFENSKITVVGFGNHLGLKHDSKWIWIQNKYPIGVSEWKPENPYNLDKITNLILTIRDFPLVYINRI